MDHSCGVGGCLGILGMDLNGVYWIRYMQVWINVYVYFTCFTFCLFVAVSTRCGNVFCVLRSSRVLFKDTIVILV